MTTYTDTIKDYIGIGTGVVIAGVAINTLSRLRRPIRKRRRTKKYSYGLLGRRI